MYLDNAATTQKPRAVIDRVHRFYADENANVHRGVHRLSERATDAYEQARVTAGRFLNARDAHEIVFVRGATEAINLVASSYGRTQVGRGDEVIVSAMEHHSNIVPWQMLCEQQGARLRVMPISDAGELDLDGYAALLNERTRMVSIVHVSNALGTVNPIEAVVRLAHRVGAAVLVDERAGRRASPHRRAGARLRFLCASAHKMFGPTGIGVLYGRTERLAGMPPSPRRRRHDRVGHLRAHPLQGAAAPVRGRDAAHRWCDRSRRGDRLRRGDWLGVDRHTRARPAGARDKRASRVPGLRIVGTAPEKAGIVSFVMDGVHPHDIGTILDREGVAIRTGHHCCQPLMDRLGVPATARVSLALYNTRDDIDALAAALQTVRGVFG